MKRRIISALCAILILAAMAVTAYAVEVVDTSRTGSISVTMTYDGDPVGGGTLTIYRVAEVYVEDWDHSFRYLEDYADCEVPLDNLSSAALAEALDDLVQEKKLGGITKSIDKNGQVTFEDLELGLYLVRQKKSATGFEKVSPFLVSLPGKDSDSYIYDVDASPKLDLERAPTETTTEPPETTTPPNLPKTGQMDWPIPLLAVTGLFLFTLGWYFYMSGRKKSHET